MSAIRIDQRRYWKVTIHRDGAGWPDVTNDAYAVVKTIRPERLEFSVEITNSLGHLTPVRWVTAVGPSVRKDGSLGAETSRTAYGDRDDDWINPLVQEALTKITGTHWSEPRLP